MLKYKLTTRDYTTYNYTKWGVNVTHKTNGESYLCSPGWLHYYHHPVLAALLNPMHANIYNPVLWVCEAGGKHLDERGLKGGCTELTTLYITDLPVITDEQRIEIAIRYFKTILKPLHRYHNDWQDKWLKDKNIDFDKIELLKQDYYNTYTRYNSPSDLLYYILYKISLSMLRNAKPEYAGLSVGHNIAHCIHSIVYYSNEDTLQNLIEITEKVCNNA